MWLKNTWRRRHILELSSPKDEKKVSELSGFGILRRENEAKGKIIRFNYPFAKETNIYCVVVLIN